MIGAPARTMRGALCALVAAVLFGASAPLSKLLLVDVEPLMLAGLFYFGAALGLLLFGRLRAPGREARVRRADLPLVLLTIVCGGVLGPVLLLSGMVRVSGTVGALLLNLEAPFTMALAVMLFREHLGRREAIAALLIVAGAAVLAVKPGELHASWIGALAIAGACLSWGLDNNLMQRLSLRDPLGLARLKTTGAACCTLLLAFALGHRLPAVNVLLPALGVGAVCYGLSILLIIYALRDLGAARGSALFASAPFAGALLAIPILHQLPQRADYAAAAMMACGTWLLLRARHTHPHTHDALVHEHLHVHDEHHRHEHAEPFTEPHSHAHQHEPLTHDHPHVSDLHHRHSHP